ncbi:MAG: hypothetical protein JWR61_3190 [Ferruginibacter sp.]|nr:hypothetical protein [Ferruginibacter sp.]
MVFMFPKPEPEITAAFFTCCIKNGCCQVYLNSTYYTLRTELMDASLR